MIRAFVSLFRSRKIAYVLVDGDGKYVPSEAPYYRGFPIVFSSLRSAKKYATCDPSFETQSKWVENEGIHYSNVSSHNPSVGDREYFYVIVECEIDEEIYDNS